MLYELCASLSVTKSALFHVRVFGYGYECLASSAFAVGTAEQGLLNTIHCISAKMLLPSRGELVEKRSFKFLEEISVLQEKKSDLLASESEGSLAGCKAWQFHLITGY